MPLSVVPNTRLEIKSAFPISFIIYYFKVIKVAITYSVLDNFIISIPKRDATFSRNILSPSEH